MISIIAPVYKTEKYIKECIESILKQTCRDFELILVDDGSPDKCPEICDKYAEISNKITVIHKENGGLVSARKADLKAARGDYIAFVDGDDYIEPDLIEKASEMINAFRPDMVIYDFYYDYTDKSEESRQLFSKEYYTKTQLEKEIYPKMIYAGTYYKFGINPSCWSKIYKKDLLKNNLKNVNNIIRLGEDAAFTYPCLMDAKTICTVKKPLYHYRINSGGMTKSYDKNLRNTFILPYEIIKKKSVSLGYSFDSQLYCYLIYIVNFLIRNETSAAAENRDFKKIINNNEIQKAVSNINLSVMPVHIKMLIYAIKMKSAPMLKLYCALMKKHLKK